ncbi:MAG: hypothetical protein LBM95_06630 [Lactobacillales bacterium]|jgi:hypothetical protein|nr:hypothetical protein [Lactobacillales bacterium]
MKDKLSKLRLILIELLSFIYTLLLFSPWLQVDLTEKPHSQILGVEYLLESPLLVVVYLTISIFSFICLVKPTTFSIVVVRLLSLFVLFYMFDPIFIYGSKVFDYIEYGYGTSLVIVFLINLLLFSPTILHILKILNEGRKALFTIHLN